MLDRNVDSALGTKLLSQGFPNSWECLLPFGCSSTVSWVFCKLGWNRLGVSWGEGNWGLGATQDTDPISSQPFQADGWCDTINNRAYCRYDGGDCCSSTLSSKKVSESTWGGLRKLAWIRLALLLGTVVKREWRWVRRIWSDEEISWLQEGVVSTSYWITNAVTHWDSNGFCR